MTIKVSPPSTTDSRARRILARHIALTTATGGIPVPATSLAIVAENAAMIAEIAGCFGLPISLATVTASMGLTGVVNMIGRAVFVEAARAMGWFAGPLGVAGIVALGATTAGLQTCVLGFLAIAIGENHGQPLQAGDRRETIERATRWFRGGVWKRPDEEGIDA